MKKQWWLDLCNKMQVAYNSKNLKTLYQLIKQAFEPKSSSVSPLKFKDGAVIVKDFDDIKNKWIQHYTELFHNSSLVICDIINNLLQLDIINKMLALRTLEEIRKP